MKKRIVSGLLAAVMVIGMLSGCGSGREKEDSDVGAGKNDVETISIYYPVGKVDKDLAVVQEAINEYTNEKIGVEVKLNPFEYGQFFQKYSLFLSGTEEIDILANYNSLNAAVSQGSALDMTDLLKEYGKNIVEAEGDYIKSGQVNGVQYAVPNYAIYTTTMGIEYRKDIVQDLGLENQVANVKSLEDWTEILAAVKEKYPDMTPFVTLAGNTDTNFRYGTWDMLDNNYGVMMDGGQTGEIVNLFETDEYKKMCEQMREWYNKGYSNKDIQTQSDTYNTLTKNDAAFSSLGKYDFNASIFNSMLTGKDIGFLPLTEPFAVTYTNVMYQIMANSEHPEASMKFLDLWFRDDKLASLMKYGIEGVHYEVKDDGTATFLEGQNAENCTYHNGTAFGISGVRWDTEDPDYVDKLLENNTNSIKSKALGFTFDTTSVANEITQLDNVCSKYQAGLECGALDPSTTLSEFNKELKKAGLDTVIAEKQKQYDEWLKNQK